MDTKILEDIGLTNAEIKVYLALLELGVAGAGQLIEKSGLQSSVVHNTINNLINKGFISFSLKGKKRVYHSGNPENILNYIDDKKKQFQEILPELLSKQKSSKEKPVSATFEGIRGIKELLFELLEAGGKEHHTFGSAKESLMLGDAFWVSYHKKRAEKGIKAELIFNESLRFWKAEKKYPKSEVRYTKEGFEPLTETIIRNDKIGIIIWTEKPIGVLIHNKAAAESYDQFFETMWKLAKK